MELANSDWEKEIISRIKTKNYYSENELIKILKSIVNGLSYLQKRNICHRDIKPQNILINENNQYKIADFGEAKKLKVVKELNTLRGTQIYMSPLLYYGLKNNVSDVKHNSYKSDTYSLGLCILYGACLNIKVIYEIREILNMNLIFSIIKKYINGRYSDYFISILRKMLETDEKNRIDFIDLEKELNK